MSESVNKLKKAPKKRHLKMLNTTHENDIRYRGPLNYQHFQILGWMCIVISAVTLCINLGGQLDPTFSSDTAGLNNILVRIASLSLPFLLIANFARILNATDGYKKQLFKNGVAMIAVFLVSLLFFNRYFIGTLEGISANPAEAQEIASAFVYNRSSYGFISFNIFVDLFLCTLVMVFLNYQPKHIFIGKRRYVFRLFTVFPIAYEIFSMLFKVWSARGDIAIPVWCFPLLTVKPPMTFVLFVILAVYVKTREHVFRRHGKSHEDFRSYLKTRKNSLNFSVFLAVMLIIVSILDFAVFIFATIGETAATLNQIGSYIEEHQEELEAIAEQAKEKNEPDSSSSAQSETTGVSSTTHEQDSAIEAVSSDQDTTDKIIQYTGEGFFEELLLHNVKVMDAVGFGGSFPMIFLAPVVLLFSYTKKLRNENIGIFIPVAAICLIVIVFLEGIRFASHQIQIEKIDLNALRDFSNIK